MVRMMDAFSGTVYITKRTKRPFISGHAKRRMTIATAVTIAIRYNQRLTFSCHEPGG